MAVSVYFIAEVVERVAPKAWAETWDNVGILIGDGAAKVERILLALDPSPEVVQEAIDYGAELIVGHHPLLFRPLKNLRTDNRQADIPIQLIQHGIAYYAAHTNLDQSRFSSSWTLGEALGLQTMDILDPTGGEGLLKLVVFVPQSDVDSVREVLAGVGVGQAVTDGAHSAYYSDVFFQASGDGMFKPLPGSHPTVGNIGELTHVAEVRLESILPERLAAHAVKALKKAHPYEEPAYDLIPLRNTGKARGYGVIGLLPEAESLERVWGRLAARLSPSVSSSLHEASLFASSHDLSSVRFAGDRSKPIRKVAIANGSGGSFIPKALARGADLLIAGDVDHHQVLDALQGGMTVCDMGHFLSEAPMLKTLADYFKEEKALRDVEIMVSRTSLPWRVRA
ncbi:MAG: Nif3-like dinuclear metal center hexameric protein [Desulfitobacteriaceae bacterium]|nr:Nif3-like dinuclear metal center hexameric protein [Desulfitobacteriaceae bacterium]MDI6879785.1 Nif3-like dinuclear metal center hexameric protein [Desulfitobacteriaceae bacterium]MDI6915330.1 Nif3-like dinuclear metal center hexameric protein [Desulfitobacteriaceae bacterium]